MPKLPKSCLNCSGSALYTHIVSSGSTDIHGPNLLPGLGHFLHRADLLVILCEDCGHVMFFAEEEARIKVSTARGWKPV